MLKNYLKLAFRNLWKSKGYSAINIVGLAIGLAVCLLITLFVTDELSYDKYNEKVDRIYRINTDLVLNGSQFNAPVTGAPMAGALLKDYPQVENTVKIKGGGEILVKKGNETLTEPHAFFAQQRTKEIGIRKVLGATVVNVTTLLSTDFIKLVFISILIASPIAWLAMNKWLQGFAYRTDISWLVFASAAGIALTIALATVSFQAIKAALASPVKSLRSE